MSTPLALRAHTNNLSSSMSASASSSSSIAGPSNGGGGQDVKPVYGYGHGNWGMSEQRIKEREEGTRRAAARQIRIICKNCQNPEPNIVEETANGDIVCGDCGLVLGDRVVDTRSEWRTFANDDGPDQSRVGNGPSGEALLEGREDFSTVISFQDNHTGYAQALQRTAARGVGSKQARAMDAGFRLIDELCDRLNVLGKTRDAAKQIFLQCERNIERHLVATGNKLSYGKGQNAAPAIASACIFIACREQKTLRTMKEVITAANIEKKDWSHSYKEISRFLKGQMATGQRSAVAYETPLNAQSERGVELLPRYCGHLALGIEIERSARYIIEKAGANSQGVVDGRSPTSVAAGGIFFTCLLFGRSVRMRDIADVAQVSETTIRLIAQILTRFKEDVVDPEWIKSNKIDFANVAYLVARRTNPETNTSTTNQPLE